VVYGTYRYRVRYGDEEHAGISERLFVSTTKGWRIAVTTAFDAPPGTPPPPVALVGGTLVDGTGASPVADSVVVVRGGRIDCAGARAACAVPAGIETVDVSGMWITPGLIDAHVHFCQTGWADGRPDALDVRDRHPYEKVQAELQRNPERYFRSYLCSGVTGVFDVGGFPWTFSLPEDAEKHVAAPHVASTGPLLSTWDFWLNLPGERQFIYLADEKAARDGVRYVAAQGGDAVKIWFIDTKERPLQEMEAVVKAAGEEARAHGLRLVVHATDLATAKAALRAGATLLVHSVSDQPVDEEFLSLARANGTIYCPTLTVRRGYLRMYQSVRSATAPVLDDPNRCVDAATRASLAATASIPATALTSERARDDEKFAAYEASLARMSEIDADNVRRVAAAGIPVAMGTDAGNPLTLHGPSVYAEMEAMQAAGLPAAQVLASATRVAAAAMGRSSDLGTLEPGKLADLVVVAADPTLDIANLRSLRSVMRGGWLRAVTELAAAGP
jgi:imidazolonepropionase-like amidohydrolase